MTSKSKPFTKQQIAARKNMDALVAAQWTLKDLQELWGRAMFAKLRERPTHHQLPGKHTRNVFARAKTGDGISKDNPAGTKLVRRFIRQASSENTTMRKLYAALTGHQYGDAS